MHTTKLSSIIISILLAEFTFAAPAAEILKPQIGEPLRDAAVTRAPDGTYYLIGTRAVTRKASRTS